MSLIGDTPHPSRVVLLTCYRALSNTLYESLREIHDCLRSRGCVLIFGTPDDPEKWRDNAAPFLIHRIPSRISGANSDKPSNPVSTTPYDEWLLDVESGWFGLSRDSLSSDKVSEARKIARSYFCTIRPSVVLLWSSGVFPISRLWHDEARSLGIPAFCLEKGLIDGTWQIDSQGMNAQCSGRFMWAREDKEFRSAAIQLMNCRAQTAESAPQQPTRRVLILGSADWAGMRPRSLLGAEINSPAFTSSDDLIACVASFKDDFPKVEFIYRPHPFAVQTSSREGTPIPIDFSGDAKEQIARADVVVCGLTSLQVEALLQSKPVVLVAVSPLWGRGVAHEVAERGDLKRHLELALSGVGHEKHRTNSVAFISALLGVSFTTNTNVPARPLVQLAETIALGTVAYSRLDPDVLREAGGLLVHASAPSQRDLAELFWDNGNGFNASQSLSTVWLSNDEQQTIEFALPSPQSGRFRIDPSEAPVVISIDSIEIRSNGVWSEIYSLRDELTTNGDITWMESDESDTLLCHGEDPTLEINTLLQNVDRVRLSGTKQTRHLTPLLADAVQAGRVSVEKILAVATRELEHEVRLRTSHLKESPGTGAVAFAYDWHAQRWRDAWVSLEGLLRSTQEALSEKKNSESALKNRLLEVQAEKEKWLDESLTKADEQKAVLADQERQIRSFREQYAESLRHITALQEALSEKKSSESALQKRHLEMQVEIEECLAESLAKADEQRAVLAEQERKIQALREQFAESLQRSATLQAQVGFLERERDSILERAIAQERVSQNSISFLERQVVEQRDQSSRENARFDEHLDAASRERDRLVDENRELSAKVDGLTRSLHEQNAAMQRLKTVYERGLGQSALVVVEHKKARDWLVNLQNRFLVKLSLWIHREKWPLT
jgi:hypothetical protein